MTKTLIPSYKKDLMLLRTIFAHDKIIFTIIRSKRAERRDRKLEKKKRNFIN